jgi:hypothetical protein
VLACALCASTQKELQTVVQPLVLRFRCCFQLSAALVQQVLQTTSPEPPSCSLLPAAAPLAILQALALSLLLLLLLLWYRLQTAASRSWRWVAIHPRSTPKGCLTRRPEEPAHRRPSCA